MLFRSRPVTTLVTVPDPIRDLFYASRIGAAISMERSQFKEIVSMRIFDLLRVMRSRQWVASLGLPSLNLHQWAILWHVVANGRITEGSMTWVAMRPDQHTVNLSLAFETTYNYHDISRAVTRLRKIGLVETGRTGMEQSIRLTEHFHRMMFECRWRSELRNSDPELVAQILLAQDWDWLVRRVDDVFRITPELSYARVKDRRRALSEAMYRLLND